VAVCSGIGSNAVDGAIGIKPGHFAESSASPGDGCRRATNLAGNVAEEIARFPFGTRSMGSIESIGSSKYEALPIQLGRKRKNQNPNRGRNGASCRMAIYHIRAGIENRAARLGASTIDIGHQFR
jgi:hypothetical protein